jgi:hypothetical protein
VRRLDEIEDALTECLIGQRHESPRELERSLVGVCKRFEELSDSTNDGMATLLDNYDVADWFEEGEQLGFIVVQEDG